LHVIIITAARIVLCTDNYIFADRLVVVTYSTLKMLTNGKDLNFAEIYGLVDQRKLYNHESEA